MHVLNKKHSKSANLHQGSSLSSQYLLLREYYHISFIYLSCFLSAVVCSAVKVDFLNRYI